jgi:glycosyltransferase involved in cell wall biosynthesis
MREADISVIVCTYNRVEMLHRALESLLSQKTDGAFSYEIVVVDDASTDNTADVVKEVAVHSGVPIRYVRKEGGGVGAARNAGVAEARGRWITFLDDDEWTEVDWLKNLLAIALDKGADCVGGTCLLDLPQEHLSRLSPLCRGMLGENIYGETAARLRGKRLPPTGNLLIAREVFDSIGGFDASMLYGGEDSDFVVRVKAAGLDFWIAPDAVVHHVAPIHRLESAHLRWCFLRWGIQSAQIDCRRMGRARMLLLCLARIGQAMLVNVPGLLTALLTHDRADVSDRKGLLWKAVGYTRECVFLVAPNIFPQEGFFSALGFRKRQAPLPQG